MNQAKEARIILLGTQGEGVREDWRKNIIREVSDRARNKNIIFLDPTSRESNHIVRTKEVASQIESANIHAVVFGKEGVGTGTLTELRISEIMAVQKSDVAIVVLIEEPGDHVDKKIRKRVRKTRRLAKAEAQFLKEQGKIGGEQIKIVSTREGLIDALAERANNPDVPFKQHTHARRRNSENYVAVTGSTQGKDKVGRDNLLNILESNNIIYKDTKWKFPSFIRNIPGVLEWQYKKELLTLSNAKEILVYEGNSSVNPIAIFFTSVLIGMMYGSKVIEYMPEPLKDTFDIKRDVHLEAIRDIYKGTLPHISRTTTSSEIVALLK